MKEQRSGRRSFALLGAVVFAAALIIYFRALSLGLVWDDPFLIGQTREIFSQKGIFGFFTTPFLALEGKISPNYFRPLVFISIWLDGLIGSGSPLVFHLTNVLLHGVASVLCFNLFSLFLDRSIAFWAALLFAIHPVHTESVYFVSGRTDILAAVFILATAVMWGSELKGEVSKTTARLWGGVFFLCALLTKEAAFFVPVALLGWDFLQTGRGEEHGERRKAWFSILGGLCLAVLLYRFSFDGGILSPLKTLPPAVPPITPPDRLWGFLEYLRLMTLPFPLKAYYTPSVVGPSPSVLVGALLTLGLFLSFGGSSDKRIGLSGFLWFFAFLFPVLGIIPARVPVAGERFLYIPSVSFCLMAGYALQALAKRFEDGGRVRWLPAILLLPLCLVTVLRADVWKDDKALFEHITAAAPDYFGGHYNLAIMYFGEKRYEEASEEYIFAATLKPEDSRPWAGAGRSFLYQGKPGLAAGYFEKALELSPESASLRFEYAGAFNAMGDSAGEREQLELVVRGDPSNFSAWNNLGILSRRAGEVAKAEEYFRKALELRSGAPAALGNLIDLLTETGRQGEIPGLLSLLEKSDPSGAALLRKKFETKR
ncbi:tetratricopeptide repeat protein [bacterium]|nr:MAG: tetratricopeptide repeat protein [bacterium]